MKLFIQFFVISFFFVVPSFAFAQTWTLEQPLNNPFAQSLHQMAYDEARKEVVLFGGIYTSGFNFFPIINNTTIWNGTTWIDKSPNNMPAARIGHMMAYDSEKQEVVMFGGRNGGHLFDSNLVTLGDTWVWNGFDWEERVSSSAILARSNSAMVYDKARQETILFGGVGDVGFLNDTWAWNGIEWIQKNPQDYPTARRGAVMTYDPIRERVVLFGGLDNAGWRDDTWEWDGTNWILQNPLTKPAPRDSHGLSFDPVSKKVFLFGGHIGGVGSANDMWLWDGTDWEEIYSSSLPLENQGFAMTTDFDRQEIVLYGGNDANGLTSKTWVFKGSDDAGEPGGKRPVLIVPGILGTELYNEDDLIWADLTQMLFDINDQFLTENLGLDEEGNSNLEISAKSIVGLIGTKDIFESLINKLEIEGYASSNTYFVFPYDWRLNLEQGKSLLEEKINQIKTETGFKKIDIVAHSMGGLLAKDYIYDFGTSSINKLVFVGTPHLGAPKAVKVLLKGDRFGIPWLEEDRMKELSRNSISVYELLPIQKYFEEFTGYISTTHETGVPDLLNFGETKDFLLNKNLNSFVFDKAEQFFSKNLHNINLLGVDVYNIAGCKSNTQAGYQFNADNSAIRSVRYTSGDETVPLVSADYITIPNSNKFYFKNGEHVELPSVPPVRDLIVNILKDNSVFDLDDDISTSSSFCNFKGKELLWRSPVEVHIYDEQNNHTGPIENNGFEYEAQGVGYDIINGEKFIFLPTDTGRIYRIEAKGEDKGTFDLLITENNNGQTATTALFNDIPVSTSTSVRLSVSEQSNDTIISVDFMGTGNFATVSADAILNNEESFDVVSPQTQVLVSGIQGNNEWYKSDVQVSLSATDENSGILEVKYSLDGGITFNNYINPVLVSTEGVSNFKYYSVDRAGNNEIVQSLEIKIDKTAPEISAEFNQNVKDFSFETQDNIDTAPNLICDLLQCVGEDEAGNITLLNFKKSNSPWISLDFLSVSYNGIFNVLFQNTLRVRYEEIDGTIKTFTQSFMVKKEEKVRIDYDSRKNQSVVSIFGMPKQIVSGIKILQVLTDKGKIKADVK